MPRLTVPHYVLATFLCLAGLTRAGAMDAREGVQLLTRTGSGTSPTEMTPLANITFEQAVDRMLSGVRTEPKSPIPTWVNELPPNPRQEQNKTPEEKMEFQRMQQDHRTELVGWWYSEMVTTDSPLTEHMTLFWHNHFTSSLQKVNRPELMFRQNELLRSDALGNFGHMLHAVAKDPAMIMYLDNQSNRKGAPNENFARELMELFTLGEGHYTEADIKEAARAFTGWTINPQTGEFVFNARQHDFGNKNFFGRVGPWNGDDILNILLEQPQTAIFVTRKLWRDLVSDTPDPAEVERLAKVFRDNSYEIRPLVRAMLLSPAFRSEANRGTLIKSPAELIVETVRTLQVPIADGRVLANAGRQMGQALMDPPNVKGWPGGEEWINSNSLLARKQFLERVSRGLEAAPGNQAMTPGRPRGPAAAAAAAANKANNQNNNQTAGSANAMQAMPGMAGPDNTMQGNPTSAGAPAANARPAVANGNGAPNRPLAAGNRGAGGGRLGRGGRGALAVNRIQTDGGPMGKMYAAWQHAGLTDPAELADLILPIDPVQPPSQQSDPSNRVQLLMMDPVYQLK